MHFDPLLILDALLVGFMHVAVRLLFFLLAVITVLIGALSLWFRMVRPSGPAPGGSARGRDPDDVGLAGFRWDADDDEA
ncbi:hypothetical protein ACFPM3_25650 [Streptomyces coeruleoprunus]|uniref:Uncharacterized protein n=1 Tax=Streptomyces coeruleoprunus TaxID=285563 RepID=A0ABV9XM07_9ACTN